MTASMPWKNQRTCSHVHWLMSCGHTADVSNRVERMPTAKCCLVLTTFHQSCPPKCQTVWDTGSRLTREIVSTSSILCGRGYERTEHSTRSRPASCSLRQLAKLPPRRFGHAPPQYMNEGQSASAAQSLSHLRTSRWSSHSLSLSPT